MAAFNVDNAKKQLRVRTGASGLGSSEIFRINTEIQGAADSGAAWSEDISRRLIKISKDLDALESEKAFSDFVTTSPTSPAVPRWKRFLRLGKSQSSQYRSLDDYHQHLTSSGIIGPDYDLRMEKARDRVDKSVERIKDDFEAGKIDRATALKLASESGTQDVMDRVQEIIGSEVDASRVVKSRDISGIKAMIKKDEKFAKLPPYAQKSTLAVLDRLTEKDAFKHLEQAADEQVKIEKKKEKLETIEMRELQWKRTRAWFRRLGNAAAVGALVGVPVALLGVGIAPGAAIANAIAVSMIGGGITGATLRGLTGRGSTIAQLDLDIAEKRKLKYESRSNIIYAEASREAVGLRKMAEFAQLSAEMLANARNLDGKAREQFIDDSVRSITGGQENILDLLNPQ